MANGHNSDRWAFFFWMKNRGPLICDPTVQVKSEFQIFFTVGNPTAYNGLEKLAVGNPTSATSPPWVRCECACDAGSPLKTCRLLAPTRKSATRAWRKKNLKPCLTPRWRQHGNKWTGPRLSQFWAGLETSLGWVPVNWAGWK